MKKISLLADASRQAKGKLVEIEKYYDVRMICYIFFVSMVSSLRVREPMTVQAAGFTKNTKGRLKEHKSTRFFSETV